MISLLICFVVCEGILNAYFFAQGSDQGLLGGFIQAAIFATVNIGFAAVQGRYTIPWVNHRNFFFKCVGGIAIFFALALIFTIALTVSHYRDATVLGVEEPAKAVINSLLNHTFQFNDITSWVLCGLTIAFGIFALFDGLKLNDSYPLYAPKYIQFEESRTQYEQEIENLRAVLTQKKDEALSNLDQYCQELKLNLVRQDSIINDKAQTQSVYENYMQQAEHTAKALLQTFRSENQLHRTDDIPAYFLDDVKLNKVELQAEYNIDHDRENIDECERNVQRLINCVEDYKNEIARTFTEQYDHFTPLTIEH
ncbi:hypothetical protein [Caviibacterium pharyngocola]|uniref:Uncharacterized protein n=1 Tax=Caviibacterium pharyngocola TaxID=28159 RepID=A0A2M8RVK6_9PAST|nr:hypothetical protein [Caviibacterium pharyngocola]PJG82904.1 hypothetical protein CVP04_05915 [Caviibacterium pharyngocola]